MLNGLPCIKEVNSGTGPGGADCDQTMIDLLSITEAHHQPELRDAEDVEHQKHFKEEQVLPKCRCVKSQL